MEYIPASETEESVSNLETVVDEINALKAVNDEDVKRLVEELKGELLNGI